MSGPFGSSQWMYSSGFYGHEISNSLRLNDGDSPHLAITPGSAGNRRTFTWSAWIKLGNLANGTDQITLFDASSSGSEQHGIVYSGQQFYVFGYTSSFTYRKLLTAEHRDPSAWMNLVVAFDTTDSTAADRIKIYVNGTRQTDFSGTNTNPSENYQTGFNNTVAHGLGGRIYDTANYFDGYISEVNLIDGTALGPDSFGQTKDGIWIPKNTSGLTFGTNGFRLEFKQTGTSQNASGIGADTSGETNHLSVTNLVAGDVMADSPTNNFATFNPLNLPAAAVLSEGNLKFTQTSNDRAAIGNMAISSGKWYYEVYYTANSNPEAGLVQIKDDYANSGATGASNKFLYITNGTSFRTPAWTATDATNVSAQTSETILGFAVDADNDKAFISVNGTYINSGDPAAGSNPQATFDSDWVTQTGGGIVPFIGIYTGTSADVRINFGQDSSFAGAKTAQGNADGNGIGDFFYAPPSGFLTLCSANFTDPEIGPNQSEQADDNFNIVLYTGDGETSQNITGVGFDPDFTWIKSRSANDGHHSLINSVAGDRALNSNQDIAEYGVGPFNSNANGSIDVPYYNNVYSMNTDSATYVAWNWKAGTSFSNDASATSVGTIDSTGSVSTKAGFSIISYTGNTTSGATIAHGLSSVPQMLIVKRRTPANGWAVYHEALGAGKEVYLNMTQAETSSNFWITSPTSSVFSVSASDYVNTAHTYICYAFHSVEGYSKVGSYVGNGNADGPFIFTGFRPAWILMKRSDGTENWLIYDTERDPHNVTDEALLPNTSGSSGGSSNAMDILSNGFKFRATSGSLNASGGNYIYLAIASQPFKFSNAR